jgi:hypothetical protein
MSPAFSARAFPAGHIHLPSVHVRTQDGRGFDYEQDLYVTGRGRRRVIARVVRLAAIEGGEIAFERETRDELSDREAAELAEMLPALMDEENEDVQPAMEEVARLEYARQLRIWAGYENACAGCGCSQSKACSGGCVWATPTVCSRCASRSGGLSGGVEEPARKGGLPC